MSDATLLCPLVPPDSTSNREIGMKIYLMTLMAFTCGTPAARAQISVEEAQRRLEARHQAKGAAATQPSGELERLRAENKRLREQLTEVLEIARLNKELAENYRKRLARYEPDAVAPSAPGQPARPNETQRPSNVADLKEFVKTVVKEPNETPEMTEVQEQLDESTFKLVDSGFVQVDPSTSVVRFDEAMWKKLPDENKKVMAMSFANFFKRHGKSGRVTITGLKDDAELASYSVTTGVVIAK
jgi:hypothetical protein